MMTLRFSALDTWFFRESRPMSSIGGSELASVFPPSPRTLLGAVRTAIGDASGVDWRMFAQDPEHPLRTRIGFGDDLGPLALRGPWVCESNDRLYPVPLFLLEKTLGDRTELARIKIGKAADTYLGRVRLPELPGGKQGFKPLEQAWLRAKDLEQALAGHAPDPTAFRRPRDLFAREPRLGIARDNVRRITDDGLLYQTNHLRPGPRVALEADLTLGDGTILSQALARLGGEGRLAYIALADSPPFPQAPTPDTKTRGLILVLLTPAHFPDKQDAWLPPGFTPGEADDGSQVWTGVIAGIRLTLQAAVLGKVQREGGWNQAEHRPRPVQSLIPAGSAYYVEVAGDLGEAIAALHGTQIGEDQALGRGHVACGLWNVNEF